MATLARNMLATATTPEGVDGGGRINAGEGNGDGNNGDNGDSGGGGGEAWVTVATFSVSAAAHLARLKLEGEGVPCVIVDEHVISTNWLLSPAVGGIKLQVPKGWLERARAVLGEESPEVAASGWEGEALDAARCKTCGKGEYAVARPPMWAVLVSVLALGIPLLFLPRVLKCEVCGAARE